MLMKKMSIGNVLFILAVAFYVVSGFMLYKGYDKMTNYYNSEYSTGNNINAYVGGDAYNYIINGNYATGFFVLSMGFMSVGTICLSSSFIIVALDNSHTQLKKIVQNNMDALFSAECQKSHSKQNQAEEVEMDAEAAKQFRITAYWDKHPEEKKALSEKRIAIEQALKEINGLAGDQRKALEKLLRDIDAEFEKDREE